MRISHTKVPKAHKPTAHTAAGKKASGGESTRKTVGRKVSGGESTGKKVSGGESGRGRKVSGGETTTRTGGRKIAGGESTVKTPRRVAGGEYARHVDSFSIGRTRGGE